MINKFNQLVYKKTMQQRFELRIKKKNFYEEKLNIAGFKIKIPIKIGFFFLRTLYENLLF